MTRQAALTRIPLFTALAVANALPVGDVGINIQTATVALMGQRLNGLELSGTVTGAGSFDAHMYGRAPDSSVWAPIGSGINIGHINGGTAITGTTTFAWLNGLQNLGWLERVYLRITNVVGADLLLDATLIPIEER